MTVLRDVTNLNADPLPSNDEWLAIWQSCRPALPPQQRPRFIEVHQMAEDRHFLHVVEVTPTCVSVDCIISFHATGDGCWINLPSGHSLHVAEHYATLRQLLGGAQ
jgi:hypothetical protein